MASLAEIRAKLAQMESKPGSNNQPQDNAIYPFWNIDEGTSCTELTKIHNTLGLKDK